MRGKGEQRQFWGTGGIHKIKIMILGNRGTNLFQGNKGTGIPLFPLGRASLVNLGFLDSLKHTGANFGFPSVQHSVKNPQPSDSKKKKKKNAVIIKKFEQHVKR